MEISPSPSGYEQVLERSGQLAGGNEISSDFRKEGITPCLYYYRATRE